MTALWIVPGAVARGAELSLLGSYWDTADLGRFAGLGARVDVPLGESWDLRLGATCAEQWKTARVRTRTGEEGLDLDSTLVDVGFLWRGSTWGDGPYLGGGVTCHLLDASRGDADDEIGAHLQLGYQSEGSLFVELFYRHAEAEVTGFSHRDRPTETVGFDVDLSGFGFGVGWRI